MNRVLVIVLALLASGFVGNELYNAEAGPFARLRARRHARIACNRCIEGGIRYRWHTRRATMIDRRQDRVETRRYGAPITNPGSSAYFASYTPSEVVTETVYVQETPLVAYPESGGSSGSAGSVQRVAAVQEPVYVSGGSAGSYGAPVRYSGSAGSSGYAVQPSTTVRYSSPTYVQPRRAYRVACPRSGTCYVD